MPQELYFTDDEKAKMFAYLNELRDSAVTNMYGAGPYLMEEFGIGRAEARSILKLWMNQIREDDAE